MLSPEHETDLYLQYYDAQVGGTLPVFHGAKRYNPQSGAGIGDIFKSVFRTVLPIALQGIGSFLGETMKAKNSGTTWKDAAKSAITPSAKNVLEGVGGVIQSKLQAGKGRKRGPKKKKSTPTQPDKLKFKRRFSSLLDGGLPKKRKQPLYKRPQLKKKMNLDNFDDRISGIKFNF